MDTKTWMIDGRRRYLRIKESLNDFEDNSPELHNAIAAFSKMDKELNDLQCQEDGMFQISLISALLNYEMGLIFKDMGNSEKAKNYFLKSKDLIDGHAMKEECIILTTNVFIQLGKLRASANEHSEAWNMFRMTHELFEQYKENNYPLPVTALQDLFLQGHERETAGNCTTVNLLQNPAISQGTDVFVTSEFTYFIFSELKKTLNEGNFDPLLSILRSCHIASYLIFEGYFQFARHILACAKKIAVDCGKKFRSEERNAEKLLKLKYLNSFINNTQVTYAAFLLNKSGKATESEGSSSCIAHFSQLCERSENELFPEAEIKQYKDEIPSTFPTKLEEAMQIFQFGLKSLKLHESFCLIDTIEEKITHVTHHSDLHLGLVNFAEDYNSKCEIHERRMDLFETILVEINIKECPKKYEEVVLRAGATYLEVLHIAYEELTDDGTEFTDENVSQINSLANKAIMFYEKHINIFNGKTEEIPENFVHERAADLALALQGAFGKVYSLISAHFETIENISTAIKYVKIVMDYITKNPEQKMFLPLAVAEQYDVLTETLNSLQCKSNTRNI